MTAPTVPRRRVRVIGIGCGHPDQITLEALSALKSCDYVLAMDKHTNDDADDPLLAARTELCARHGNQPMVVVPDPRRDRDDPSDYVSAVKDWHEARAAAWEHALLNHDGVAGLLVWGDPAWYDSTLRILELVRARGRITVDYDVLPGVSSLQVLAARHRTVLHEIGQPLLVTTGRRLHEAVDAGHHNIAVMLDGNLACRSLDGDWRIWWGANLSTDSERLVAGPLRQVLEDIAGARKEAKRASGWVMDTYLLRRDAGRSPGGSTGT